MQRSLPRLAFLLILSLAACAGPQPSPLTLATLAPASDGALAQTHTSLQCATIIPDPLAGKSSQGVVVVYERNPDLQADPYKRNVYLLDMRSGQKTLVDSKINRIWFISVSPNKKWIAYYKEERLQLIVARMDGKIEQTLPIRKDWLYLAGWLDDDNLLIQLKGEPAASSFLLLDPFNGGEKVLRPNPPKSSSQGGTLDWEGQGESLYRPALDQLVFPDRASETFGFSLWDIQARQVLATVHTSPHNSLLAKVPRWSPDGSRFVVAATGSSQRMQDDLNRDELFIAGRDGTVSQLTHLTSLYGSAHISRWSWSPDGQQVAFEFSAPGRFTDEALGVVDTRSGAVTVYCVAGAQSDEINNMFSPIFSENSDVLPPPIWSPDGGQILVENRYAVDASRLIVLDLASKTAWQIGENLQPAGWGENP